MVDTDSSSLTDFVFDALHGLKELQISMYEHALNLASVIDLIVSDSVSAVGGLYHEMDEVHRQSPHMLPRSPLAPRVPQSLWKTSVLPNVEEMRCLYAAAAAFVITLFTFSCLTYFCLSRRGHRRAARTMQSPQDGPDPHVKPREKATAVEQRSHVEQEDRHALATVEMDATFPAQRRSPISQNATSTTENMVFTRKGTCDPHKTVEAFPANAVNSTSNFRRTVADSSVNQNASYTTRKTKSIISSVSQNVNTLAMKSKPVLRPATVTVNRAKPATRATSLSRTVPVSRANASSRHKVLSPMKAGAGRGIVPSVTCSTREAKSETAGVCLKSGPKAWVVHNVYFKTVNYPKPCLRLSHHGYTSASPKRRDGEANIARKKLRPAPVEVNFKTRWNGGVPRRKVSEIRARARATCSAHETTIPPSDGAISHASKHPKLGTPEKIDIRSKSVGPSSTSKRPAPPHKPSPSPSADLKIVPLSSKTTASPRAKRNISPRFKRNASPRFKRNASPRLKRVVSPRFRKSASPQKSRQQQDKTGSFWGIHDKSGKILSVNGAFDSYNGSHSFKQDWSEFFAHFSAKRREQKMCRMKRKSPSRVLKSSTGSSSKIQPGSMSLKKKSAKGQSKHRSHKKKAEKVEKRKENEEDPLDLPSLPRFILHTVDPVKPTPSLVSSKDCTSDSFTIRKTTPPTLNSLRGQGAFRSYSRRDFGQSSVDASMTVENVKQHESNGVSLDPDKTRPETGPPLAPAPEHEACSLSEPVDMKSEGDGKLDFVKGDPADNTGRHNTKFLSMKSQNSSNDDSLTVNSSRQDKEKIKKNTLKDVDLKYPTKEQIPKGKNPAHSTYFRFQNADLNPTVHSNHVVEKARTCLGTQLCPVTHCATQGNVKWNDTIRDHGDSRHSQLIMSRTMGTTKESGEKLQFIASSRLQNATKIKICPKNGERLQFIATSRKVNDSHREEVKQSDIISATSSKPCQNFPGYANHPEARKMQQTSNVLQYNDSKHRNHSKDIVCRVPPEISEKRDNSFHPHLLPYPKQTQEIPTPRQSEDKKLSACDKNKRAEESSQIGKHSKYSLPGSEVPNKSNIPIAPTFQKFDVRVDHQQRRVGIEHNHKPSCEDTIFKVKDNKITALRSDGHCEQIPLKSKTAQTRRELLNRVTELQNSIQYQSAVGRSDVNTLHKPTQIRPSHLAVVVKEGTRSLSKQQRDHAKIVYQFGNEPNVSIAGNRGQDHTLLNGQNIHYFRGGMHRPSNNARKSNVDLSPLVEEDVPTHKAARVHGRTNADFFPPHPLESGDFRRCLYEKPKGSVPIIGDDVERSNKRILNHISEEAKVRQFYPDALRKCQYYIENQTVTPTKSSHSHIHENIARHDSDSKQYPVFRKVSQDEKGHDILQCEKPVIKVHTHYGHAVKQSKSLISVGQMLSELTAISRSKNSTQRSPKHKHSKKHRGKVCKIIYFKPVQHGSKHSRSLRQTREAHTEPDPACSRSPRDDRSANSVASSEGRGKKGEYIKYYKLRKIKSHRHEPYRKHLHTSSESTVTPPSGQGLYYIRNKNNCSPSRRGRYMLGPLVDRHFFVDQDQPPHMEATRSPGFDSRHVPTDQHEEIAGSVNTAITSKQHENNLSVQNQLPLLGDLAWSNLGHVRLHYQNTDSAICSWQATQDQKNNRTDNTFSIISGTESRVSKAFTDSKLSKLDKDSAPTETTIPLKRSKTSASERTSNKCMRIPNLSQHWLSMFKKHVYLAHMRGQGRSHTRKLLQALDTGHLQFTTNAKPLKRKSPKGYLPLAAERPNDVKRSPPITQSHMTQTENSFSSVHVGVQTTPSLEALSRNSLHQYKSKNYGTASKLLRDKSRHKKEKDKHQYRHVGSRKSTTDNISAKTPNTPQTQAKKSFAQDLDSNLQEQRRSRDQALSVQNMQTLERDGHEVNQTQVTQSDFCGATAAYQVNTEKFQKIWDKTLAVNEMQEGSHSLIKSSLAVAQHQRTQAELHSHQTLHFVHHSQVLNHKENTINQTSFNSSEREPTTHGAKPKNSAEIKSVQSTEATKVSENRKNAHQLIHAGETISCQKVVKVTTVNVEKQEQNATANDTGQSSDVTQSQYEKPIVTSFGCSTSKETGTQDASDRSIDSSRLSELRKLCVMRPLWKNANVDEIDRRVKRALRLREELQHSRAFAARMRGSVTSNSEAGSLADKSRTRKEDTHLNNGVDTASMRIEASCSSAVESVNVPCREEMRPVETSDTDLAAPHFEFKAFATKATCDNTGRGEIAIKVASEKEVIKTVSKMFPKCRGEMEQGAQGGHTTRHTPKNKSADSKKPVKRESTFRVERSVSFHEDSVSEMTNRPERPSSVHGSSQPSRSNSGNNSLKRAGIAEKSSPPTKISKVENTPKNAPRLVGALVQNLPQVPLSSFVEWFIETSDPNNFITSDISSSSSDKPGKEQSAEFPREDLGGSDSWAETLLPQPPDNPGPSRTLLGKERQALSSGARSIGGFFQETSSIDQGKAFVLRSHPSAPYCMGVPSQFRRRSNDPPTPYTSGMPATPSSIIYAVSSHVPEESEMSVSYTEDATPTRRRVLSLDKVGLKSETGNHQFVLTPDKAFGDTSVKNMNTPIGPKPTNADAVSLHHNKERMKQEYTNFDENYNHTFFDVSNRNKTKDSLSTASETLSEENNTRFSKAFTYFRPSAATDFNSDFAHYDTHSSQHCSSHVHDHFVSTAESNSSAGTKTEEFSRHQGIFSLCQNGDHLSVGLPWETAQSHNHITDSERTNPTEEASSTGHASQTMSSSNDPVSAQVVDTEKDDEDRCGPGIRHILMKLRHGNDTDDQTVTRPDRMRITVRKSSDITGIIAKFQKENP